MDASLFIIVIAVVVGSAVGALVGARATTRAGQEAHERKVRTEQREAFSDLVLHSARMRHRLQRTYVLEEEIRAYGWEGLDLVRRAQSDAIDDDVRCLLRKLRYGFERVTLAGVVGKVDSRGRAFPSRDECEELIVYMDQLMEEAEQEVVDRVVPGRGTRPLDALFTTPEDKRSAVCVETFQDLELPQSADQELAPTTREAIEPPEAEEPAPPQLTGRFAPWK